MLFWEKEGPWLCISDSDPMHSFLRKVEELGLNASAGHTWKFSGCTWYKTEFGKEKRQSGGIIQKGEPHERNLCAPGFEEQPLEETSRQADCTSKVAWNLARKYASRTSNYVLFSCEGARDRRSHVYCVFGSFSAQCWARRFELRYNGYFEKVQNHLHMRLTASGDSANKRVSTSFCSWSRSVRNSAITWKKKPAILLLHRLCSKRGYSYEWKTAKICDWPKMRRQLLVQWTTQYLSSYQDCHMFQQHVVFNIEINGAVQ